jgi:hypothetical protein
VIGAENVGRSVDQEDVVACGGRLRRRFGGNRLGGGGLGGSGFLRGFRHGRNLRFFAAIDSLEEPIWPQILVMAGLDPAIHVFGDFDGKEVDARDKPGHDD